MMSNPLSMILSQMQRGINPDVILSQMARNNPQIAQVMNMTRGKSDAEMRQFAQNLAKERGVDLDGLMRSMGISIPSSK